MTQYMQEAGAMKQADEQREAAERTFRASKYMQVVHNPESFQAYWDGWQAAVAAQAETPGAQWREKGEPDPHGNRYDCERAELALGALTDDELANGAFMNYDQRLSVQDMLKPKPGQHMPIVWMTAVKDRIRWLSRKLAAANEGTLTAGKQGGDGVAADGLAQPSGGSDA